MSEHQLLWECTFVKYMTYLSAMTSAEEENSTSPEPKLEERDAADVF